MKDIIPPLPKELPFEEAVNSLIRPVNKKTTKKKVKQDKKTTDRKEGAN